MIQDRFLLKMSLIGQLERKLGTIWFFDLMAYAQFGASILMHGPLTDNTLCNSKQWDRLSVNSKQTPLFIITLEVHTIKQ